MLPSKIPRFSTKHVKTLFSKAKGTYNIRKNNQRHDYDEPKSRISKNLLSNKFKRYFSSTKLKQDDYELRNPKNINHIQPLFQIIYPEKSKNFDQKKLKKMLEIEDEVFNKCLAFFRKRKKDKIKLEEAEAIASIFGYELLTDRKAALPKRRRPPVVTIMGHVDHGKTSLLDAYRNSKITDDEFGGITQKVGGFMVDTDLGKITFIDTPGHSLFTNMRERGAKCTDMVILVISAIEGVQTQEGEIPFVIALNKIDDSKADPERVEDQLFQLGVEIEPKGGNIPVVHISATEKINIDLLLELVLFEADNYEIESQEEREAVCIALESKHERGKLCSLVVRDGSLKVGDVLVGKKSFAKVKALYDDVGNSLDIAYPGAAVEVMGFKTLPEGGDVMRAVAKEKHAKLAVELNQFLESLEEIKEDMKNQKEGLKIKFRNRRERKNFYSGKIEEIFAKYEEMKEEFEEKIQELELEGKDTSELKDQLEKHLELMDSVLDKEETKTPLIIRSSDFGTLETVETQVRGMKDVSGVNNFRILFSEIGPITEGDVDKAIDYDAKILSMDNRPSKTVANYARDKKVEILHYDIIYKLIEDMEKLNEELNRDVVNLQVHGKARVKQIFDIRINEKKTLKAYGLGVEEGVIEKEFDYRLIRNDKIIEENMRLASLKSFSKEVDRVRAGNECGISFLQEYEIQKNDLLECYTEE